MTDINETAKVLLNYDAARADALGTPDVLPFDHLRAMARLWLVLPSIREFISDYNARSPEENERWRKLCIALEDDSLKGSR